jgi:predicted Rossmann-fold nucleotide-binding protein
MESVPVILVGSAYWQPFDTLVRSTLLASGKIDPVDANLYRITDDEDEVLRTVAQAKVRHVVQSVRTPVAGATPRG